MRYLIFTLFLVLIQGQPAAAHAMRVFVQVEETRVSGYAFFIGGGRPHGAIWSARMDDKEIAAGQTDVDGGFAFAVPRPVTGEVSIIVDTREGHVASARLDPERFGGEAEPAPAGTTSASPRPAVSDTPSHVESAIERQMTLLLERIEEMDARMRLSDTISGLFLIFGLAGMGLWALGRRK